MPVKNELEKIAQIGLYAQFEASNMAAGPCPHAAQLDGKRFNPKKAPTPPFSDCPHPDQCACFYSTALTLTGEF